jgi:predicted Zn-dependent peptidase
VIAPRTMSRAAVFAALFVCIAAGRASAQAVAPNGTLPSGVTYEIRANPAEAAAAISLWYRAPAGGFEARSTPGLSRLAAATVAASTPITGTPLAQLVDRWGGRLTIAAYPDSVAVTALVPADHAAATVRTMTAVYFAPVVTAAGLQVAKRDAADELLYRSFGPEAIEDVLGAALFDAGPSHDGTIGTAAALGAVSAERVGAFAERAFRPSNAILVLAGNVDGSLLAAVAARAGAERPGQEPPAAQTARSAAGTLRREGNIEGTGLAWTGPAIAAEADATALDFLADALFAPKTGIVAKSLGARKATATGRFVTFHDPGVFLVTITGADASAAVPIVRSAIAAAAKPMPAQAFESARAGFVYRLLTDMETPAELAETYGWYAVEGNPGYAPADGGLEGRYFSLAVKLTPEAVAAVVARYLSSPPGVVTMVKASTKGTTT